MNFDNKSIISIYAAQQIFTAQAIPGILTLYSDKIVFNATDLKKGNNLTNTFEINNICKLNLHRGLLLSKIYLTDSSNEIWNFKHINNNDAKSFLSKYNALVSKLK
ncbi:hypothetical protein MHZ36_14190 [Staphylococcus sp. ACRSN]|uniref:hypothetical protein n=1 Tax=Staphylococcus sp. ACRSN TaxID=2918214 RepID=UPI001EF3BBCB|nr:hypothetical protein [Staphylococcus sp. ACRSN]MCG7340408.1 hypothetical protein [Staphylococcus sp. ACRSN]